MDITSNYFELFDLPVSYNIDRGVLKQRYRDLQKLIHPDKHVGQSSQQQRVAEQYASYANQAYTTLLSPLLRAQYLLSHESGEEQAFDNVTHQDSEFLFEQIELREQLDEVRDSQDPFDRLNTLEEQVGQRFRQLQQDFCSALNNKDYPLAAQWVAKMYFFDKLQQQLEQLEHELEEL